MVVIDFTAYKFFIYNQCGILLGREEFHEDVEKYGLPIEVSNNGLVYIM